MKQRRPPDELRRVHAIPRRNRRGLIEAPARTARPGGKLEQFPGEIAGASLKPPPEGRRPARTEGGIPRRNRRGLIEARPGARSGRVKARDSPAKSPGPH